MITLSNVYKAFGSRSILEDVSVKIPTGARTFIVGGSGSGKSVLTKLILGLEQADQGTITIEGEDINTFQRNDWQRVLANFGVVFQGAALFDSLNVLDNVGIKLFENRKLPASEIEERVVTALAQVDLRPEILRKYPAELSGGMRKRVGIARAIIQEPRYLVYDEPTTGLDPASSDVIDDLIESLAQNTGRTSIVITHDMHSVRRLASQVVMIYQRQIWYNGEAHTFFSKEDEVISAFLARERRTKAE